MWSLNHKDHMKRIGKWIALGLLGIVAYYTEVIITQRGLIYFPSGKVDEQVTSTAGFHSIQLKTRDGLQLTSWYHPSNAQKGTLLFLHGNAGNITTRVKMVLPYLQNGYGAFLLEYRGYSTNPGKPSMQGLLADADAAWEFLTKEEKIPTNEIIVMGESLGSGIAVHLASTRPIGKLILQSPYTSLTDVGRYQYPYLPVQWFLYDRYPAEEWIHKVHVPLLILHGDQDDVIPISFAQILFKQANEPKKFVILKGKRHDLFSPELVEVVQRFLAG